MIKTHTFYGELIMIEPFRQRLDFVIKKRKDVELARLPQLEIKISYIFQMMIYKK